MINLLVAITNVLFLIMVLMIINRATDKGLDAKFCLCLAWFTSIVAGIQLLIALIAQVEALYFLSFGWAALAIANFYGAMSIRQSK